MLEKSSTTSSLVAALFLLCRELLPDWKGWPKTVALMLEIAGSGKTQAYEILDRLRNLLPTLLGTPGRPASQPATTSGAFTDVVVAAYKFVLRHPGSACYTGERRTYADDYRCFIVGLVAPGQPAEDMSLEAFSQACDVPLGTLKEWLTLAHPKKSKESAAEDDQAKGHSAQQTDEGIASHKEARPATGEPDPAPAKETVLSFIRNTQLRTIAALWPHWKGTFQGFCRMIRTDQRLPYSDSFISDFLQSMGLRHRKLKTPVESPLSRGTFRNLFPGAQWLGDGTTLAIRLGGRIFIFNVEALLDCASNGTVGINVSDTENEEALRLAFEAGVKTAGVPPLSTTVDNRSSNISPGGREAVGAPSSLEQARLSALHCFAGRVGLEMVGGAAQTPLRRACSGMNPATIFLRATPGRGQAKAALEGSFGLFKQAMPPLVIEGESLREMARSVLHLVLTAWYRGRNGRPRKRLGGASPKEFYENARPTEEDIREAIRWFQELQRREIQARRTREARRDPVRVELLKQGLADLGIPDPHHHVAISLAYYSPDAIAHGLAVFRAKKELGTIPSDADHARYLGGIICQTDTQLELDRISKFYLEQRIRLSDITLRNLEYAAQEIRAEVPQGDVPQAFADRALKATYAIDFDYWARAAARALATLPAAKKTALYHSLCRRIAGTFKADKARREKLICILAEATALAAA